MKKKVAGTEGNSIINSWWRYPGEMAERIRALLQPRPFLALATGFFSLTLLLGSLGFRPADIQTADLNPTNWHRAVDRQVHLAYARAMRFANHLRLVYEIRTRLEEVEREREQPSVSELSSQETSSACSPVSSSYAATTRSLP